MSERLNTARRRQLCGAKPELRSGAVPAVLGEMLPCRHAQLRGEHLHDVTLQAEQSMFMVAVLHTQSFLINVSTHDQDCVQECQGPHNTGVAP